MKTTNPVTKFTKYQIFVVAALALLQFTIIMDFQIIMPLGDMLMKGLSIDTAQFGLLVSCYAFGAGIMGVLISTIADKFDRRKLLIFFYTGFILGTLLCGLSHSYRMLVAARSITGLFGGVIASITMAIVSDLFSLNQRGRVMGFVQMAFSVSQVLGIPAGILIANRWGWNATFFSVMVLACIIWIAIITKFRPIIEHKKLQISENMLQRLWRVLSTKAYLTGFVFLTFVATGGAMIMPFSATFLINNVGVTLEQLPLVYIFTGVATIIAMPLIGRLSDRMEKYKLFVIGSLLSIAMTVIFSHLTPVPFWAVIVINIMMFVGISSGSVSGMALITAIPSQGDRGSYMSLGESLQLMANGMGAIVAGFIIAQHDESTALVHFDRVGYIVATMSVFCIFLLYRINKMISVKLTNLE
ncbi:MAG: MFS transporter [Dysgonamonadaceae bacterium]|jgi:predicted MFS family arabinose efflux permease|nr:MFS transporter [Dysgonamonadaceae bacterium]